METLTEGLQYLCSQSRCFSIDQTPLPVCQRCLGLYTGFALTVVWLALSGIWRRGLAPNGVLALHVGVLLVALAGGLHWIDPGPRWRLACGLWTGHVAAFWILGGIREKLTGPWGRGDRHVFPKRDEACCTQEMRLTFSRSETTQAVLALPLLFALAMSFYWLEGLGWWFWTLCVVAGIVTTFTAVAAAIVVLTMSTWRRFTPHPWGAVGRAS
jgi:hypothetical protein